MKKRNKFLVIIMGFALFPLPAFAFDDIKSLVSHIIGKILQPIIPFLIALTVGYFLWGITKYVLQTDNPEERIKGRAMMLYGIIALAVMISFWGLAKILVKSFGF
ncbi:MAG: hypothetical protein ABIJ80_00705 [Patescibacteria group bacterium]|nr:hypothetical protein [Patescibacteria group bacterium]MBU2416688.1 hypothetical protein [Patescibacteria group bacterium]MBU2460769.1 hypothetical protein [Patescibacteria group bacterium]